MDVGILGGGIAHLSQEINTPPKGKDQIALING
jgi:hypothetical protein